MPQLGETVAEGKITKWFKAAGDAVKPGDNLFEIETDKTSMEVPSTTAGTLTEIRFQVGEVAKVGAVVAVIAGAGGAARHRPRRQRLRLRRPRLSPPRPAPAAAAPIRSTPMPRPASPMDPFHEVRTPERNFGPAKLARRGDCHAARAATGRRARHRPCRASPVPARMAALLHATWKRRRRAQRPCAMASGASAAQVKALYEGIAYEEVPLDSMRRTIATRLVEAKQTIPHFYLTADLDAGRSDRHARGSQRRRAKGQGRPAGVQALAQRFHHQGLGGGACSAFRRPMRCGQAIAFSASGIPISALRSRLRAA